MTVLGTSVFRLRESPGSGRRRSELLITWACNGGRGRFVDLTPVRADVPVRLPRSSDITGPARYGSAVASKNRSLSRRPRQCFPCWRHAARTQALAMAGIAGRVENLVPKLVPDSSELSRTPWTRFALSGQIRPLRHLPAELLIRRSLVRIQPGALTRRGHDGGRTTGRRCLRHWMADSRV
jgi:hypothetical protein